jgi:hypothetical protein
MPPEEARAWFLPRYGVVGFATLIGGLRALVAPKGGLAHRPVARVFAAGMATAMVGCSPPPDSSSPRLCEDIKDADVASTSVRPSAEGGTGPSDGTYTLYIGGDPTQPWTAYCDGMDLSEPSEYLTVERTSNRSEANLGDPSAAPATTEFWRYRIDIERLEIDPRDDRFATTENAEANVSAAGLSDRENLPAGWAEHRAGVEGLTPASYAQVDLAGTRFAFSDALLGSFFCASRGANVSAATTAEVEVEAGPVGFNLTATGEQPGETLVVAASADCANTIRDVLADAVWPIEYLGTD